ncbi:MAG: MFS transporter [Acutalibacteraceae bacterium]|jgi:fucose permease
MNQRSYRSTRNACYTGFVVQAIVNNLAPILFIIFQTELKISYTMISNLVLINFVTQLAVDMLSVKFVDRIGYRPLLVASHLFCGVGLILLGLLPRWLPVPYVGLVIAVIVYAVGGGLIEVLVSPTIESLPSDHKAAAMSLLHSFYCWGQVAVVLISTLALRLIGHVHWMWLPICWSVLPLLNAVNFLSVPLVEPAAEEKGSTLRELFSARFFLIALVLMTCAGASELAMSQWASLFAEKSLGISKVLGDLLGPCMFAVLMGAGRMLYGLYGHRVKIHAALTGCAALCVAAYLLTALSPWPMMSLVGCGLCGLSVSLMWPGVFSLSAASFPRGGTAMFALLAMFGDLGCSFGPWLAGVMSDVAEQTPSLGMDSLKFGILIGTAFPLLMTALLLAYRARRRAKVHA